MEEVYLLIGENDKPVAVTDNVSAMEEVCNNSMCVCENILLLDNIDDAKEFLEDILDEI